MMIGADRKVAFFFISSVVLPVTIQTASAFQPLLTFQCRVHNGAHKTSGHNAPQLVPSLSSTALQSNLAVSAAVSALDSFWQSSPYVAAAIICASKASAADFVAQKRDFQKRQAKLRKVKPRVDFDDSPAKTKQEADWKRNIAFIFYGALYQVRLDSTVTT
jgi:hypothetical protein